MIYLSSFYGYNLYIFFVIDRDHVLTVFENHISRSVPKESIEHVGIYRVVQWRKLCFVDSFPVSNSSGNLGRHRLLSL